MFYEGWTLFPLHILLAQVLPSIGIEIFQVATVLPIILMLTRYATIHGSPGHEYTPSSSLQGLSETRAESVDDGF